MKAFQTVTCAGFLGKDPMIRQTGSGKSVGEISICVEEKTPKADGTTFEKKEWITIKAWGRDADILGTLRKGEFVFVRGKMETESYEKDGIKRYITKVLAEQILTNDSRDNAAPKQRQEDAPDWEQRKPPAFEY